MRFLFLLLILLAFPIAEIWVLIELAARYGWLVLAYLLVVGVLGWRLIQDEKLLMLGRMAQTIQSGGTPIKALFGSAKNLIAGILLILPGVISDAIAVILLLIPAGAKEPADAANEPDFVSRETRQQDTERGTASHSGEVIEGEYRREE
ncbi:FxsA family protein [Methylobacillus gramineus]|uniref:FxsA family protein n=1 Tax=Methylobacillus gramineus TaxID=755169 RepID=UPI001CFF6C2E|nr:FxsA family protein [Methylobacillus gramineus]MCB5185683.1 FxsA family protein [Methylobacillus gramineus]